MVRPRGFLAHSLLVVLTALIGLALPGQSRAERVALIIGNSAYSSSPLINPVNDATDMAERLTEIGFRVHGDGPMLDQDLHGMQVAIRDFTRSLNPGDLAVFYFAGHGVEYKGTNYLIPTDDEEIAFAEDVPDWAYPAPRLLERLAATGATGVIILDACRNNPLPERGGGRDLGIGLSAMDTPAGASAFILYAAAPGQTSSDGEGRNGLFTGALLQALERPTRRIDDIMYEVSFAVRNATQGRQVPWLEFAFAGEIPPQFQIGDGRADTNEVPVQVEEAGLPSAGKPGRGIEDEGDPLYGTIELAAGPPETAMALDMLAGGYEDASQLGGNCYGFVASSPDFQLDWQEAIGPLRITTLSDEDTVLVMRRPDGTWQCRGTSSDGSAPVLALSDLSAGSYRIWVGTERELPVAPDAELIVEALLPEPVAIAPVVQDDAGAGLGFIVTSPSETPPAVALNPEATIERAID
ncbi:caspase family protein [Nioella sp.]|uniref:caspase family protein n=1 Tax=Nioella sp. TaxID=1912091 RepID=UPI003B524FC8